MRCFVAIELDLGAREALASLVRNAPRSRDVRWCSPEQLHVTLKFLGDVDDALLPGVCDAVVNAAARVEPFTVALGEIGAFPNARSPRVLWCGLSDPSGGCAAWLRAADPAMEALGFEPERRALHPHITLARSRAGPGNAFLARMLAELPFPPARETSVEAVVLFQSTLDPRGVRYTPMLRAPLGGT
ncbi:MAG: RNA 2',3'-cyclic phosphodiesterase [Phycisphaerae bacterium]|jgi:2'-5' RNA ligase